MSRTIRRIRDKRRNDSGRSHFEELFTWEWTDNGLASHKVKLEGQAYDKAWWRFHGDRIKGGWSYSASLREMFESTCRAKNKLEVIRFMKDHEYEVMTHTPPCLSNED